MDQHNRRRRHYVDHMLQGRLLIGLLATEVVLVVALLAALYLHMGTVLEENVHRSHFTAAPSLGQLLAPGIAGAVIALLALNCGVVLMLERLWSRRVEDIVVRFRELTRRTRDLDLGADGHAPREHRAVAGMLAWREDLRRRQVRLGADAARLDPAVDPHDAQAMERQRETVSSMLAALATR